MPLIVQVRKGRGGKLVVVLDDNTRLRVSPETALQMGLAEGLEMTEAEIELLSPAKSTDPEQANEQAARILSRRPLSKAELTKKLAQKDFPEEAIAGAIEHMQVLGFLDDAAYAIAWAEEFARKNLSKRAAAAKLYEKGISRADIEAAIAAMPAPNDAIDTLLRGRTKGAPLTKALQGKLFQYLYGRGFDSADIQSALRRYTDEFSAEEGGEDFE